VGFILLVSAYLVWLIPAETSRTTTTTRAAATPTPSTSMSATATSATMDPLAVQRSSRLQVSSAAQARERTDKSLESSTPTPLPLASVVTAVNRGKASDTLALGLLGFAAVLILAAAFYGRITTITFPGGGSVSLTPEQQQNARKAVAKKVGERTRHVHGDSGERVEPGVYKLAAWALSSTGEDADAVSATAADAVEKSSHATQIVISRAQMLLGLGRVSPDALGHAAEAWGISRREWQSILDGTIPRSVWERLAERALDEVGMETPAEGSIARG
jgi:hypothetical protein